MQAADSDDDTDDDGGSAAASSSSDGSVEVVDELPQTVFPERRPKTYELKKGQVREGGRGE